VEQRRTEYLIPTPNRPSNPIVLGHILFHGLDDRSVVGHIRAICGSHHIWLLFSIGVPLGEPASANAIEPRRYGESILKAEY